MIFGLNAIKDFGISLIPESRGIWLRASAAEMFFEDLSTFAHVGGNEDEVDRLLGDGFASLVQAIRRG
ncbi:hypothetical protein BCR44DRAFT_1052276 [Catenaria anguillulae PL171]|uniref:Uncharacterized protein n=1 Tax=Catenaria anguillulae PL171 TaxID=765915 RepID=A0A1Y2HVB8_9FUNG|nr:hypothetical protein BCR44DRAFT_1052276 [Catenaria anguillulae PL171]